MCRPEQGQGDGEDSHGRSEQLRLPGIEPNHATRRTNLIVLLISVALAIFGLLTAGLPGGVVLQAAESLAGIASSAQLSSDQAWPAALAISLLAPFALIPAHLILRRARVPSIVAACRHCLCRRSSRDPGVQRCRHSSDRTVIRLPCCHSARKAGSGSSARWQFSTPPGINRQQVAQRTRLGCPDQPESRTSGVQKPGFLAGLVALPLFVTSGATRRA